MNTDMNQYLIFQYASTVVRKMTAYQLCCAGLARSPFVLTEHISSLYMYVWRYVCLNSSACHTYIMWAELGHNHFIHVSSHFTTGNGHFKMEPCALVFV